MDSKLLQSSETVFPSSANNNDFFDSFKNMSMTTWIIIILVLAFLGLNIFVYLAKGTQTVVDIFNPIVEKVFKIAAIMTGETVDVAADGAKLVVGGTKTVVDKTADAIDSGLTAIQNITPNISNQQNISNQDITPNTASSGIKGQPFDQPQISQGDQSTLNRALNTRQIQQTPENDYQAYEASSSVHSAGKSGWCFIGEDRGFRTCAQVGVNDTCMSGDIFPSHEICMNPNLRT